ncbi:MAG: hypothetical protein LBI56_03440 [Puniceicoccales bacterium]|jgi:hypothetical protein|nr:hypothetical protein [Puniceicoccales bacterium]
MSKSIESSPVTSGFTDSILPNHTVLSENVVQQHQNLPVNVVPSNQTLPVNVAQLDQDRQVNVVPSSQTLPVNVFQQTQLRDMNEGMEICAKLFNLNDLNTREKFARQYAADLKHGAPKWYAVPHAYAVALGEERRFNDAKKEVKFAPMVNESGNYETTAMKVLEKNKADGQIVERRELTELEADVFAYSYAMGKICGDSTEDSIECAAYIAGLTLRYDQVPDYYAGRRYAAACKEKQNLPTNVVPSSQTLPVNELQENQFKQDMDEAMKICVKVFCLKDSDAQKRFAFQYATDLRHGAAKWYAVPHACAVALGKERRFNDAKKEVKFAPMVNKSGDYEATAMKVLRDINRSNQFIESRNLTEVNAAVFANSYAMGKIFNDSTENAIERATHIATFIRYDQVPDYYAGKRYAKIYAEKYYDGLVDFQIKREEYLAAAEEKGLSSDIISEKRIGTLQVYANSIANDTVKELAGEINRKKEKIKSTENSRH